MASLAKARMASGQGQPQDMVLFFAGEFSPNPDVRKYWESVWKSKNMLENRGKSNVLKKITAKNRTMPQEPPSGGAQPQPQEVAAVGGKPGPQPEPAPELEAAMQYNIMYYKIR